MSKFTIPKDRHVLIAGMTRSGKSFFCEQMLARYNYVVKLDTKHEYLERRRKGESPWTGLEEGKDFIVCHTLEELEESEVPKLIYAPDFDLQTTEEFDRFFRWIYDRENTIVWIDELMSFTTSHSYSRELQRILIMGNSKNVAAWCCCQRPSGIPTIILANVYYVIAFNLNFPADRKKLADITGSENFLEKPEGHNFWFYKMGEEEAVKAVIVI